MSAPAEIAPEVPVRLGFTPPETVVPDPERPGLLRAGPRAGVPYGGHGVEHQVCGATDCGADGAPRPDLLGAGFDTVDLSGLEGLQATCDAVRRAGRVDEMAAAAIRTALDSAVLRTAAGDTLRVLYLSEEGFIMRAAGPNGMAVAGPRSDPMNGHGGATAVHADQDVHGTPMAQLMDGRAPELFVHDSPDGSQHDASMLLVNVWIPLQQTVQPLVLADGRSIDRRRHQLRFGLQTGSFLERDGDMEINDIWMFLHDAGQQWYFRSDMDHRSAYVFNTLSTPHGAGTLPGEDVAERHYRALEAAEAAVRAGDRGALAAAVADAGRPDVPERTTPSLRAAVATMAELLADADADPAGVLDVRAGEWIERAQAARRQVVRMSLEMRMVVTLEQGGAVD